MDVKTLILHPERCNNCKECETACIESRTSLTSPGLSCIRILKTNEEDFFFPIACKQCENPPCQATCPKEAIYRDAELDRVLIDRQKCVGCGMCVSACPFGAMKLDKKKAKSYKCDLCQGDPECVKVCEPTAIEYVPVEKLSYPNMVYMAGKLARLKKP
ncbi:MAG: 4Fe-4S dicluster domain-containing protein [Proteobacteria bacterium]|nr:4Fe-4S dicluster domain-containing protein [Pseudomonadota bacterium]MBU1584487.1 4Fe-4S dicluster domain-containing protein [Pseudomonadota bacterium]MBU2456058.1 4Fe-4S dicluster domain-containing protein [Pseudomonadota bacterium]